ncbi:caspase-2-like [Diadema antillarum]|uniref:caspase-2-like n=1 Tax=Diadema antillarum TaxID=105358 RepID=UPI003A86628D
MTTENQETIQVLGIAPYIGSSRDMRLDLNYRNIQRLPYDLFKLTDLHWLNLNVNKLSELPEEFGALKHLKWLYLETNLFEHFPDVLCELKELIRLYLSDNSLKLIPRDICKLTNLRWLDLSDNSFWEFPLGLCDKSLSNLERLVLNNNKLTYLPAQIAVLRGLKVFHLNGNQLEWLPQSICNLEKIEDLQLTNNHVKILPAYLTERLKRLRILKCTGCPLIEPLSESLSKGVRSLREYQYGINRRAEMAKAVFFKPQTDEGWIKPSYQMRTRPRGVAVIIDNFCDALSPGKDKPGEANTAGFVVDSSASTTGTNLRAVLIKLGFNVRMMRGLMSLDIISALRFLSLEDHSYFDCMMVCVLSHGDHGKIIGPDGVGVEVRQLTDIFTRENCPSLAEKPKMFFIQILGKEADDGKLSSQGSDSTTTSSKASKSGSQQAFDPLQSLIPEEDDFLLTVAMLPPSVMANSTRDVYTLYVNVLFDMLQKYARKLNILDVLTAVHAEVRTLQIPSENDEGDTVCPILQSTLRYDLFLSLPAPPTSPDTSRSEQGL